MNKDNEIDILYFDLFILERWRIINSDIEFINKHHMMVEKTISSEIKSLENQMWKEVEQVEYEDQEQEVIDEFSADIYDKQYIVSTLHRGSILITTFSFIESVLNFYCGKLKSRFLNKESKIPKGSILTLRKWLEKEVGVTFKFCENEWLEINNFRILRNSIVHSFGDIGNNDRLEEYIEKSPYLEFSEFGMGGLHVSGHGYEIYPDFFPHVLNTYRLFIKGFSKGLEHLFEFDEEMINEKLKAHSDEQESLRLEKIKALGDNPSMTDWLKHIY